MTAHKPSSEQSDSSLDRSHLDLGEFHPVALTHLKGGTGGHWWKNYDVEPPAKFKIRNETVTRQNELPPEHQPDVPEHVDWSEYEYYHCRFPRCNEPCLNPVQSPYALDGSCRGCYIEANPES